METYKEKIFVETGYLGANVSCISTEKGLVLIDSPFLPQDARDWARRIQEQTGRDIACLINTDHHFDHVMGNTFLTDRIICHSTASDGIKFLKNKQELIKIVQATFPGILEDIEADIDDLQIDSPLIAFDRKLVLDMGDAKIILEFVGGHSPGTIFVYLMEERAIFTGDNVEAGFPYFGQARIKAWMETLQKFLSMEIEVVVPGHGPVGGKAMVEKYLSFFKELEAEVKDFHLEGFALEQMVKKSKAIDFFPRDNLANEGMTRLWVESQYISGAKRILAESPN